MDVHCTYQELPVPVSRNRMFKACKAICEAGPSLLPELLPDFIANTDIAIADGAPGTLKRLNIGSGAEEHYRVDMSDPENCIYKATLLKSGLQENAESVVHEMRMIALGPDRSIVTMATEFHPREGKNIEKEEIDRDTDVNIKFVQSVAAYLLANPDAYT